MAKLNQHQILDLNGIHAKIEYVNKQLEIAVRNSRYGRL